MAYGNVLGYTPGPQPGSYAFQQANGQSTLLTGPPAASLKAKLDASSYLAGQPVAGPGGGAPADAAPAPNMSAAPPPPEPAMSVAPPPAPGPTVEAAGAPTPAPQFRVTPTDTPDVGVPGAIAAPPPAPSSTPYTVNGVNTGLTQGPDGRLYKHVAPTAALTRDMLLAQNANGVAMDHSVNKSVTGGFAPSQQYLDEREKLAADKGVIIDKTAEVDRANALREQQLAEQQFKDAAAMKAEEQARTDAAAARVQKDEATKDALVKDYGNARVDPRRIFHGPGGGANQVMAALAAGLGAFGSGMQARAGHGGVPNYGLDAVNRAIDADINSQENAIKVKGNMADNALAQYQKSGLTLDQARAALKVTQLSWAAAQAQRSAALTKGSMVDVNAANMQNGLMNALNEANEEYRQKSIGTATTSVAATIAHPHAGSAGGMVAVSPTEALGTIKEASGIGATNASTAKTIEEVQHPKMRPEIAKRTGALADIETAQQQLQKAGASAGLTFKDGKFEGSAPSILTEGVGSQNHQYLSDLKGAAPAVIAALGQKRLSQGEYENWAANAATRSGESNKDFLQAQYEALEARKRAVDAGGGGVAETTAAPEPEPEAAP